MPIVGYRLTNGTASAPSSFKRTVKPAVVGEENLLLGKVDPAADHVADLQGLGRLGQRLAAHDLPVQLIADREAGLLGQARQLVERELLLAQADDQLPNKPTLRRGCA